MVCVGDWEETSGGVLVLAQADWESPRGPKGPGAQDLGPSPLGVPVGLLPCPYGPHHHLLQPSGDGTMRRWWNPARFLPPGRTPRTRWIRRAVDLTLTRARGAAPARSTTLPWVSGSHRHRPSWRAGETDQAAGGILGRPLVALPSGMVRGEARGHPLVAKIPRGPSRRPRCVVPPHGATG